MGTLFDTTFNRYRHITFESEAEGFAVVWIVVDASD